VDVILIRHAMAIDETLTLRDPSRYLTVKGREQARKLGARLRERGCTPTLVWASPLVRAVQTAELVAHALGATCSVDVVPELAPGDSPRAVARALQALPAAACVVVVGHEPALSALGALLVGAPDFAALAKAEAVRIHAGALAWRVAWDAAAPAP